MRRIGYPAITICLLICIGTLCNCKKEEKDLPSLITVIISSVTKDSALLGGLIINDGGADITARGVCYGVEWIDWEVIWPKWVVYGNEISFRTSE